MRKAMLFVLVLLLSGAALSNRSPQTRFVDGGAPEPHCIPGDANCHP